MAATYIETHRRPGSIITAVSSKWQERVSSVFWFSVCLVLFMVLGPFAAPIALGFLFSKHMLNEEMTEPESLNEEGLDLS